jgi:EAL domain-containing protein (putative c-di-GMP-specific phosphodiesterase class I)/GGDEF domain-containing protein
MNQDVLRSERDRYLAFAFAWADLIVEAEGRRIVFVSGACEPLLGRKAADLRDKTLEDLVAPADRRLIGEIRDLLERHGRVAETPIRLQGPGTMHPKTILTGHALGAGAGNRLFLAFRTSLRFPGRLDKELERDSATGLYARDHFDALAASRLKDLATQGKEADIALVAVDGLDGLCAKLADEDREALMAAVGTVIRANSLDGDTAVAVDPEKFALVTARDQGVAGLEREISDLVAALDPKGEVQVAAATIQVGNPAAISEADLAKGLLYTLQKFQTVEGAVSLQTLAAGMNSMVDQTVGQIVTFRRLVSERQFDVALQPIIGLRGGDIHHFEALCRFHALGKDVSPYKVINFAEETGQIHQFDLAMAAKVIEWLNQFPRNNDMYRVAVNVSGYSIGQEAYVEGLFDLLAANDWTEGKLSFEVTESSRMSDLESANAFIQKLRGRGYEVCLDDFGAGAASFQYLASLDVDVVKLDGSAVKNAQKAVKGRAFLSALCELCRRLGVDTVAEMVDNRESLDFVRDCGCDYVQGWLFGKPSTEVKDFLPYPNRDMIMRSRPR